MVCKLQLNKAVIFFFFKESSKFTSFTRGLKGASWSHVRENRLLRKSLNHLILKAKERTSLVVQWLRLHAPNAGGPGSIPGQRTRCRTHVTTKNSHATTKELASCNSEACEPQLRSPPAATKDPTCRN